jgi:hypothetical protein
MTLEEVKAALAPFARFAELFTHNTLGVAYEDFYTKTITVNGEYKEFKISGADFDRAKDAYDFLAKIDPSKQPEAPPAPQPGETVVELTETTGLADPADATTAIHETKQEPLPEKKGKGK